MYCLDTSDDQNMNFTLQGDFFDEVFSFMKLQFIPCFDTEYEGTCQSRSAIIDFLSDNSLNLMFYDTFIDPNDIDHMFKIFKNDETFFNIAEGLEQKVNIRIRKGDMQYMSSNE